MKRGFRRVALLIVSIFILSIIIIAGCSGGGDGGGNGSSSPTPTTSPTISPTPSPTATGLTVDIYDSTQAYNGTTLFPYLGDADNPRVIEVDMNGNIVWQFSLPEELKEYTQPGFDAELLSGGTILLVLPRWGLYEIDRNGSMVWSYQDQNISHDADRLSNGNTVYVFGNNDTKNDAQVKEVTKEGEIVWSWYAKNEYDISPYDSIWKQGWTHVNSVTRMSNGNTLINLRNFNMTIEVDSAGKTVWSFDWTKFGSEVGPHEPELLSNNHILIALQQDSPYQGVEIDKVTGETIWTYTRDGLRTTREADRLPNGNSLFVSVLTDKQESVIFEVNTNGEIVWQLIDKGNPTGDNPGFFYKAQRIGSSSR